MPARGAAANSDGARPNDLIVNLNWPARVHAALEATQGAMGRAGGDSLPSDRGRLCAVIAEPAHPISGVLSPPNAPAKLQRIQIRVRAKRAQSIAILCQLQRSLSRTVRLWAPQPAVSCRPVPSAPRRDG